MRVVEEECAPTPPAASGAAALVFIHGFERQASDWDELVALLTARGRLQLQQLRVLRLVLGNEDWLLPPARFGAALADALLDVTPALRDLHGSVA